MATTAAGHAGPDGTDAAGAASRSMARLSADGLWSVLSFASTAGAVFVVSVLLGRALGPADFGRYSYVVWIVRTVPGFLALGIPTALSKMIPEQLAGGPDGPRAGARMFRLALRLHIALLAVPVAVTVVLLARGDLSASLAVVVIGGMAAVLFGMDYQALFTGLQRFRLLTVIAVVSGAAQILLSAVGFALGFSWEQFLLVFVAVSVVGLVALAAIGRPAVADVGPPLDGPVRSAFLRLSGIATFTLLVNQVVWGRPELLFLELFRDDAAVGNYSAALRLAGIAAVLPIVAAQPLLPEFARLRGTGDGDALGQVFSSACRLLVIAAAPMTLVGAALAGPTVELLFGRDFDDARVVATVLVAGSLLGAAASPLTAVLLTGHRLRTVVELGILGVVTTVAFDVVLIARFGVVGAGVANVAAQLVWVAAGLAYAWFRLGLRYPFLAAGGAVLTAAVAAAIAFGVVGLLPGPAGLVAGGVAGLATYVAVGQITGFVRWDDVRNILRARRDPTPSHPSEQP